LSAYIDTSVLLPTLIAEASTEAVYNYLGTANQELLISDFGAAEVASALSRLVRMLTLTGEDASARLADFDAWRAAMSSPVDIQAVRLHFCSSLRAAAACAGRPAPRDRPAPRRNPGHARSALGRRRARTRCRRRDAISALSRARIR